MYSSELGLSHIINAEGEKLQYALGTLEGATGLAESLKIEDLLNLNKSVRDTLGLTMQNQLMLNAKMGSALSAPTMRGPAGPAGATGPQGVQGPEGPQGEQGIQGPAGPQGPQGLEGPEGPQGLTGLTGAQGPQGIQGVPGENGFAGITVRGNYDPAETYDVNDYVVSDQGNGFVARVQNPTGPPPDEFVSNDEWAAFVAAGAPGEQGVQGQEGQIGRTGSAGPRGPEGPQGEQGIQGSTGPEGPRGTAGPQGAQGIQGIPGPTGATGAQGPKGDTGATGAKGDQGPPGPKGDPGPEASSFTIIPFASQRAPLTYASNGEPTRVSLIGFGYLDRGIGADVAIPLASDGSFNLSATSDRQVVFSVPFDMKITNIYATVGNFDVFPIGQLVGTVFPYVQLYKALPDSNTFNPILETAAIPVQGLGPTPVPAATMLPASATGLNVELTAGTRIAIGGLVKIQGDTASRSYYLYFTGGIGMTRWVR